MLCPKWNRPWQKQIEATIRSECEQPHKFAWKHSRFQTWQHTAASTQKRSPPTNSFIAANQWRIQKFLQVTRTEKNTNSKDNSLNPTNDACTPFSQSMTPRTNGPRPPNRTCKECQRKIPWLPHSRSKQTLHKFGCEKTWPRRYLTCRPPRNWREGTKQKIASLLRRIKDLCPTPDYISSAKNKWNLGRVVYFYLSYRPLQVIQVYAHNILHRHRAATDLFCCRRDSATSEGTQNEALICSYGLNQFIPSPIQTLQN